MHYTQCCNISNKYFDILLDEEYVELEIPIIDQSFIGTGDFFTALLLIWMNLSNNDLKHSIEKTVATIQAVLKRTIKCNYLTKNQLNYTIIVF